jgi:creatinine amidohydrolase
MGPEWKTDRRIYLPHMTVEGARQAVADGAVLLVPTATIEQHGLHGPLQTDIDNVWAACLATAEEVDADVRCVVAAPVWFTISPFDPAQFPGSMRMREDVFKEALGDILESYLFAGFKRVAVVNGHGGGTEWHMPEVVRRLNRKESRLYPERGIPADAHVVTFEWFALMEVFAPKELAEARGNPEGCADWHAGDAETSLQLYLRPGLVDMEKAVPGATMEPLEFAPWDIGHSWYYQYIIADYWGAPVTPGEQDAITGRPDLATPEEGRRILELAAKVMGRFVREWAGR